MSDADLKVEPGKAIHCWVTEKHASLAHVRKQTIALLFVLGYLVKCNRRTYQSTLRFWTALHVIETTRRLNIWRLWQTVILESRTAEFQQPDQDWLVILSCEDRAYCVRVNSASGTSSKIRFHQKSWFVIPWIVSRLEWNISLSSKSQTCKDDILLMPASYFTDTFLPSSYLSSRVQSQLKFQVVTFFPIHPSVI